MTEETMKSEAGRVAVEVFSEREQGAGAFDGGKITEIKPIPFPQEPGGSRRIGPLFYWARASARGDGVIGMHPHKGFEIMSYVLEGSVGHTDTGGNRRRVGAGGAQVMRTGSGISHEEEMFGERTDFYQIWFEPDLRRALARPPEYADFEASDFPEGEAAPGVQVVRVIGEGGPVEIAAPVSAGEVRLEMAAGYDFTIPRDHALAMACIEGGGELAAEEEEARRVAAPDFVVVRAGEPASVSLRAGAEGTRVFAVQVPLVPEYPLYSER